MSKSEEHLLTPDGLDGANYRMSWTEPSNSSFQDMGVNGSSPIMSNPEVKSFSLEPDITVESSPAVSRERGPTPFHSQPDSVLESSLSGDESNLTSETLLKIQKAFSESGSDLHTLINQGQSSVTDEGEESEASDGTVRGAKGDDGSLPGEGESCVPEGEFSSYQSSQLGREASIGFYSAQVKVEHKEDVHSEVPKADFIQQELPSEQQTKEPQSPGNQLSTQSAGNETVAEEEVSEAGGAAGEDEAHSSLEQSTCPVIVLSKPQPQRLAKQQSLAGKCNNAVPGALQMTEHGKVSDHIQWFNKLSLNEPNRAKVKSPLKFQRTPVRQSVRRINSLLEYGRQPVRQKLAVLGDAASPLVKSVSCDGALPSCVESTSKYSSVSSTRLGPEAQASTSCDESNDAISKSSVELTSKSFSKIKRHPDPVHASLGTTRLCKQESKSGGQIKFPLDDLTNHDRSKFVNNTSGIKSRVLRKPSEKERVWYKGSPKNPIGKTHLLPTSKPVDL